MHTLHTLTYKRQHLPKSINYWLAGSYQLLLKLIYLLPLLLLATACAFKTVSRRKEITYLPASKNQEEQTLSVFAPSRRAPSHPVLIFVHGGNWTGGRKGLYNFFGNRLARKGVVAVIINYPLSPKARFDGMAMATAAAAKWTHQNIAIYGGDSARIYISGHSAGGHLAALVATDNTYFDSLGIKNPLKGAVMIDAAGLDMVGYLKEGGYRYNPEYLDVFTRDQTEWKRATPLHHLHHSIPPFLVFRGGKTYPSIIKSNEIFMDSLRKYQPSARYIIQKGRHHVPMITQFLWSYNVRYTDILKFMGVK